jgi:uncharacterized protein
MSDSVDRRVLVDTTANPAPFGFMAFGMATILFTLHNAGLFELSAMILAMAIFCGGLAQVFVSWMEWKKGNAFGTVAFGSYGFMWLTLAGLLLLPRLTFIAGAEDLASSSTAMGWFFLCWLLFTVVLLIGSLRIHRAMQLALLMLSVLLLLLVFREWAGGAASSETLLGVSGSTWAEIAGWQGIIPGLGAIYIAVALLWNELYGRVLLPLGPYRKPEHAREAEGPIVPELELSGE